MPDVRKVVKVFIASPSDLVEERKVAKAVAEEVNTNFANPQGYHFELVGWELTVSIFGRPQATINKELAQCEVFVGMLHRKWGIRPAHDGPYTSGFEEEFRISLEKRRSEGRPEMSLYFKHVPPDQEGDAGPELAKVMAFKQELIDGKEILFENFIDARDFEGRIRHCLASHLNALLKKDREETIGARTGPTTTGQSASPSDQSPAAWQTPLSPQGAEFLRKFVKDTENEAAYEQLDAADVARFRLLDTVIGRQGNDEHVLGTHDANLLFAARDRLNLGTTEVTGLLTAGLARFETESVPLWHWCAEDHALEDGLLVAFSVFSGQQSRVRSGAIGAMQLVGEQLENFRVSREKVLARWFDTESTSEVRVAALRYLSEFGISADILQIRKELDRNDSHTSSAAVDAIVRIRLRDSRASAFGALLELEPTVVHERVLEAVFKDGAALQTQELLKAIGSRNASIRRFVVELLGKRKALSSLQIDQLMSDDDPGVRYEALKAAEELGRQFSDSEAKRVLVRPAKHSGLAFGGLLSAMPQGEDVWEKLRIERLRAMKSERLREMAAEELPVSVEVYLTLVRRNFARMALDLRRAVDDQFKARFEEAIDRIKSFAPTETMEQLRSMEADLRKRFTREGLELLCEVGNAVDLARVRSAVQSGMIGPSLAAIKFLGKHGEWSDIPLIVTSAKEPGLGDILTMSSVSVDGKYRVAAEGIYALGQSRIDEVLSMELPSRLRVQLLLVIPDAAYRRMSDETLSRILRHEDVPVRKAASLKCVRALPLKRLRHLLIDYTNGDDTQYYNVIHWLDLGVSVPKIRAARAAARELEDSWPAKVPAA